MSDMPDVEVARGEDELFCSLGNISSIETNKIDTYHKLIVGDARKIDVRKIGKVHLVVTSPPYWTIKDYGNSSQIGFKQELSEYIKDLLKVWRKCYKALLPGCRMVINVGDQYMRSTKGNPYQIIPIHAMIVNSIMNDNRMEDVIYLGSLIWRKVSTTNTSGGASVMGSYPYPRSVYPCFENEYIAMFRKPGKTPPEKKELKELAKMSLEEWRDTTKGIWAFPGAKQEEHPAAFPEKLPEKLIRMFTFPGETVLDPFVGSGTSMRVAASLGRNSIGIDVGFKTKSGRSFKEVIKEKVMTSEKVDYSGNFQFKICENQGSKSSSFSLSQS